MQCPDNDYDLINEYFTPRILSGFLKAKNNPKESVQYLDYIAGKVDGDNKEKILEVSVIYDLVYAKTSVDAITNLLEKMENTNEVLMVADTILDTKITNEENIFITMNYMYANKFMFDDKTISDFANRFYSLYKTNSAYIYGLLNKVRVPESDFIENINNAYKIFKNEDTNTMFIFYAYEDNQYRAYSYVVGDDEVKKYNLINNDKLKSYLHNFTNASKIRDRVNALKSLENSMLSSDIQKDASRVKTIYITGAQANLFKIPFAYLNSLTNNDVIKIREFKYVPDSILNVGEPRIILNAQTNFYTSLETLAVKSFNNYIGDIPLTHYIGIDTNAKPYDKEDIFLSPAMGADISRYLRSRSNTKLMFTHTSAEVGDYYTVMKYLYSRFDKGVIDAYRYIRTHYVPVNIINTADVNNVYMVNHALFDYILPGIPKKYK